MVSLLPRPSFLFLGKRRNGHLKSGLYCFVLLCYGDKCPRDIGIWNKEKSGSSGHLHLADEESGTQRITTLTHFLEQGSFQPLNRGIGIPEKQHFSPRRSKDLL